MSKGNVFLLVFSVIILSFTVFSSAQDQDKMRIVQGSGGHKYLIDSTNAETIHIPERLKNAQSSD
ncbi:hypothetical protein [Sinanaerobacter sp. ZZT-01]|uniref:hypothetical protein n=1 Tax=Sinanaerobacter sp. ZZT-01 TaxID=3111540 RepID=UPI002D781571|nr:hypothetical protein [Sinanaerobacter sp. ZZT-01]WRR94645.1 hypothetical protein U5921_05905 [Sinanaerobacter sp. ZZT-01]